MTNWRDELPDSLPYEAMYERAVSEGLRRRRRSNRFQAVGKVAGVAVAGLLSITALVRLDGTATESVSVGAPSTMVPDARPPSSVPAITITTLHPTADTYVNEGAPTRNFGRQASDFSSELFSRGNLGYVTYLQFTLPTAPAGKKLTDAVLTIRTTPGSSAGSAEPHYVWLSSDSWSESDITWNTRPPLTPTPVGVIMAPQVDTAYSIPLNVSELRDLLGSQGTLAVTNTSRDMQDNLIFWGSEFEVETYRPQLVLTFR